MGTTGVPDLLERLAHHEKPWANVESWESLEGEFLLEASCSSLGKVTFAIRLRNFTGAEEWDVSAELETEMGQLLNLAKTAKLLFGGNS